MEATKIMRRSLAVAAACLFAGGALHAAPIIHQGSFSTDDAYFAVSLNVAGPATLSAFTTSWASGGFAPVLTLFGGAGGYQQWAGSSNACGDAGSGSADPVSGFCWDARFAMTLDAGTYTLVLTQDGNVAQGGSLADGFTLDGWTDYTSQFYLGLPGGRCINVDAAQRSCDFVLSVDLVPDDAGAVPEPGSLALLGAGLLAAWRQRRRRR